MNAEQKRIYVGALYPGPGWKKKVRKMSDAQVSAIYLREHAKPKPKKEPPHEPDSNSPF